MLQCCYSLYWNSVIVIFTVPYLVHISESRSRQYTWFSWPFLVYPQKTYTVLPWGAHTALDRNKLTHLAYQIRCVCVTPTTTRVRVRAAYPQRGLGLEPVVATFFHCKMIPLAETMSSFAWHAFTSPDGLATQTNLQQIALRYNLRTDTRSSDGWIASGKPSPYETIPAASTRTYLHNHSVKLVAIPTTVC